MKAITVCQPQAHAIIWGDKRIENRTWPTTYRGRIAIHAAATRSWLKPPLSQLWPFVMDKPPGHALVFGAIIGFADLIDCVPVYDHCVRDNKWAFGPFCWILNNIKACAPIPHKGRQRLWDWPGTEPEIEYDYHGSPCQGCH